MPAAKKKPAPPAAGPVPAAKSAPAEIVPEVIPPRRWVYLLAETLPPLPGQAYPAHRFVVHLDPERTVLKVTKNPRGEVVETEAVPDPRYLLEWHWSEDETMSRARIVAEVEAIADFESAKLLPGTPIPGLGEVSDGGTP